MSDDTLRKEKYRCSAHFAVTVADLWIKAANPNYNRQVVVKSGEYILTELLDFEDLKRSRTSGSLDKLIKMGMIAVESPDQLMEKPVAPPAPQFVVKDSSISERAAKIVDTKVTATAVEPKTDIGFPKETPEKIVTMVPLEKSRTPNSFSISEMDATRVQGTDAYDKFTTLRYFQKLKAIKETADVALLEHIASKSSYPQLVHNAKNRLREITTGK